MRYVCELCHKLVIIKPEEMIDAVMYAGTCCKSCYDAKYADNYPNVKVKEVKDKK